MTQLDRIALASRIFCLLAALGLTSLTGDLAAFQYTLLVATVGLTAWWLSSALVLPHAWAAAAEGAFAGLLVGIASHDQPELLPYLIAPPLVAGLAGGLVPLIVAILGEGMGLVLLSTSYLTEQAIRDRAEFVAPWLVVSFGAGLLGAWLRVIGLGPATPNRDGSYEAARRLVTQLRTVARRLSSGLDPVGIAEQIQGSLNNHIEAIRAAVFVRTDGGVLSPLSYDGDDAKELLVTSDVRVDSCWVEMEPAFASIILPTGERVLRIALPLRVGSRMIGVALADSNTQPGSETVGELMQAVDDSSLRLDTALAFDEVRSIATVEERQRLAREIHDGIAQEVASLGYMVDDLRAQTRDAELVSKLDVLRGELTRMVSELRLSIFDLRSGGETAASLGTALSDYVQRVGAKSKMTVHLTLDEAPTRLRREVETELLRIAQEAITNARKHSTAQNLWVDCWVQPPSASITVRDDGVGLRAGRDDSYGLRIMRERAARIDARLDVHNNQDSSADSGTMVRVRLGAEQPLKMER